MNSESALVFENQILSHQLADLFYQNDLIYSLPISIKQAEEFLNPESILYTIEKGMGDTFKEEL